MLVNVVSVTVFTEILQVSVKVYYKKGFKEIDLVLEAKG